MKAAINVKLEDVNVDYANYQYIDEDTFDMSVNYINDTYNTLRCKAKVIKKFPDDLRVSILYYILGERTVRVYEEYDILKLNENIPYT